MLQGCHGGDNQGGDGSIPSYMCSNLLGSTVPVDVELLIRDLVWLLDDGGFQDDPLPCTPAYAFITNMDAQTVGASVCPERIVHGGTVSPVRYERYRVSQPLGESFQFDGFPAAETRKLTMVLMVHVHGQVFSVS